MLLCWCFLVVSTIFKCTHCIFLLYSFDPISCTIKATEVVDRDRIAYTILWIFHIVRFYQLLTIYPLLLWIFLYFFAYHSVHFSTTCKEFSLSFLWLLEIDHWRCWSLLLYFFPLHHCAASTFFHLEFHSYPGYQFIWSLQHNFRITNILCENSNIVLE